MRTSEKNYKKNWRPPVNGDYLPLSCDGGDTWTEVVQFLSGVPTTQCLGIREIRPGALYVTYDDNIWAWVGRTMGFQIEVTRKDQ